MNQFARFTLAALLVSGAVAQTPSVAKTAAKTAAGKPATEGGASAGSVGNGDVERGRYIVENVAMCTRCHTPGGDKGQPDRSRWLQGAPIRDPDPNWAVQAPRIAGTPPGTDEQVVNLLVTGISRTGAPPRPPMPNFHMSRTDAASVLAYLKSLRK